MGDIGNSAMDAHNRRAADYAKRIVTPIAPGSAGDMADRFDAAKAYRPGAHPEYAGTTALENIIIKGAGIARGIAKALTPRPKPAAKP